MRMLIRSLVTLALGLPVPVLAQTVTRADLVGVWVQTWPTYNGSDGPRTEKHYVVLRDDSTWAMVGKLNDKETSRTTGRWAVSNDSLWFGDATATDTTYDGGGAYLSGAIVPKFPTQKVEVGSGKLRFTEYEQFARWTEKHQEKKPLGFNEYTKSTETEP